jgi:putative MATE family efflux protein
MGASAEVRTGAATYVRIRALAAPALLVVRAALGAYRGYQDTATPFRVVAVVNGLNLVLDPLLIFTAGMGIAGAAWGTVAAQWLGAGLFVYLLTVRHRVRLGIHLALPDRAETAAFLRAAAHLAVRSGSLLAVFTLATAVAARVSDAAVAAHQVVFQVWLFLALGLDALAVAGQAMVGARLGAGNGGDARAVADRLLVLGLGLGLVLAALVAAVAPTLPWWFTANPRVVSRVRSMYWLLVAAQPVGAVVFVRDGVFLGAGDFAYLAAATGGCSAAAGLLLAVLPKGWGLPGVWWAILALIVLRGLTLAVRRVASAGPLGG